MLGTLLSGCKSSQRKNSSSESQESSLKEENSLLKENSRLTAKEQELEAKNSSSSIIENKTEASSKSTTSSSINSPNDVIALARSKYGDNNGDSYNSLKSCHFKKYKVMTFEAIFMKITYSTTTKLRLLSQFQNVNESLKVFADYHNVGAGSFFFTKTADCILVQSIIY
ncbi:hypothetical protein HCZ88_07580 [Limosilactobacillus fermentum]